MIEAVGNITFDIKDHPVLNDIFEKGVLEGFGKGELRGEIRGGPRRCCANSVSGTAPFPTPSSTVSMPPGSRISTDGRTPSLTPPAWMPCSIRRSTETARTSQAASPFRKH
jgi:hypothetical protein